MTKTLQKQLPLLSLSGLRDFAAKQTARHEQIKSAIAAAQAEIAKIDAEAKPFYTGGTRMAGTVQIRTVNRADAAIQAQVVERKSKVRVALNEKLMPVWKAMVAASTLAKEYAERHWTLPQVLNRATTGNGNGATEGIQRRAAYSVIFEKIGKAQLFDFCQLAIDTGDAVLQDACYRAVMTRTREERPFQPAEFISLIVNSEHTDAQAILQGVLDAATEAGRLMASFEGRSGAVNHSLITAGLAKQGKIADDDFVDEAGGIKDEALLRFSANLRNGR